MTTNKSAAPDAAELVRLHARLTASNDQTALNLTNTSAAPDAAELVRLHARLTASNDQTALNLANTSAAPDAAELVHLHAQACNALHSALRHLTSPDCSPAMWAAATARAHRGLAALKQASAMVTKAGGCAV